MIFVTTGTQLPFPRLVAAIAGLAGELGEEIVAQIGVDTGNYPGLTTHATLTPLAFKQNFEAARVIVSHAGVGTILSAKQARKPLILFPRRHALGEHRNDHQLATARQVEALPGLHVAWQVEDLLPLLQSKDLAAPAPEPGPTAVKLVERLKAEIDKA